MDLEDAYFYADKSRLQGIPSFQVVGNALEFSNTLNISKIFEIPN